MASCNDQASQAEKDAIIIDDYALANGLTIQKTASGLAYFLEKDGSGLQPNISSSVRVHYEGFLLDGTKFDSSIDRGFPSTFPLTNVIKGWQEGIPLVKEGGRIVLIIPSALAYGGNPPSGSVIGKNEVLRFNVDLINVF